MPYTAGHEPPGDGSPPGGWGWADPGDGPDWHQATRRKAAGRHRSA